MDFNHILVGTIGILAYILIPGIALGLAIYPRKQDIGTVKRIGLSLFFGLTTVFVQYFLDKNFSIPINQSNTFMTIAALTLIGLLVWVVRLKVLPKKEPAKIGA